jgi:hypothetical protein
MDNGTLTYLILAAVAIVLDLIAMRHFDVILREHLNKLPRRLQTALRVLVILSMIALVLYGVEELNRRATALVESHTENSGTASIHVKP